LSFVAWEQPRPAYSTAAPPTITRQSIYGEASRPLSVASNCASLWPSAGSAGVAATSLEQQNPDGSWDNTGGCTIEGLRDEVTAEFVALLDEVVGALM